MLASHVLEDRRDQFRQKNKNTLSQISVVIAPNMACSLYKLDPVAFPHMTDTRWKPFDDCDGAEPVKVNRLYASERFFDKCRKTFESNEKSIRGCMFPIVSDVEDYVYAVNVWLAIVDHYGFDVEYRREFVLMINDISADIFLGAYRIPGDKSATAHRSFNGQTYSRREFLELFDAFLVQYGL